MIGCRRVARSTAGADAGRSGPFAMLALLLALLLSVSVQAAPRYRFKEPPPATLSAELLSAEERQYLATLSEIRVAVHVDGLPPYERVDADGTVSGIQADILGTLARAFGLRLQPVVLSDPAAAVAAAERGDVDLVLTIAANPERLAQLNFTLGTVSVPAVLIVAAQRSQKLAVDHGRIVVERGYPAQSLVARRYPGASVVLADTTEQALRMLAANEADAYVGSLLAEEDLLARQRIRGIEVREMLQEGLGYWHFAVRKDWPRLVPILNKGISAWRSSPQAMYDGAAPPAASTMSAASAASAASAVARARAALSLAAADVELLARRGVWRVGAVRGSDVLNGVDAEGKPAGLGADYAEQVARRLGVALEFVPFDNTAAMLGALREGRIDVVPFAACTAEAEPSYALSPPYLKMPFVLVGRVDAPMYWGLSSLNGRRLALTQDSPLRPLVSSKYPAIELLNPRDGNEALDMVVLGEADAAAEIKLLANVRISGEGAGVLRALGDVAELPAEACFAASAAARELMPLIDRALADIDAAQHNRLLERWVAVEPAPGFQWRRLIPIATVAMTALALLVGSTWWWQRRFAAEASRRRRADQQLDDISRGIPGVVFRYVLGGRRRSVRTTYSSGAAGFFGFSPARGQTVVALLRPYVEPEIWAAAEAAQVEALRTGQRLRFTLPWRHPGGQMRWLRSEALCTQTSSGHQTWSGNVVDVSTERALQERLAQQAPQPALAQPPAGSVRRSGALLLCDDDDVSRRLLAAALEREGHTVEAFDDGINALARWRKGGIRALVTELTPMQLDGQALVAAVHAAEAGAAERTAVVVWAAMAPADGAAAACDAFVAKPAGVPAVLDALRRLIH